jgi:uncharacterized membrane protein YqjE
MTEPAADTHGEEPYDGHSEPARELTLHLLRMLETRAEAGSIALQAEMQSFTARLQLRVIAGAAMFLAAWAGIVLLAIVLPAELRVPVLASVVGLLVVIGVIALLVARRKADSAEVGSMAWFLASLKLDLEVFSRVLEKPQVTAAAAPAEPGSSDELAA